MTCSSRQPQESRLTSVFHPCVLKCNLKRCNAQGILMASPDRITRREALARLWAHESLRVFHDRLINAEDKDLLRKLLAAAAAAHLPNLLQPDELSGAKPLLFGDFHTAGAATEEREYEEVRRELHPVVTRRNWLSCISLG